MSPRQLPARANLDHLKAEAKALLKSDKAITKLSDAQRVIAREYGFATWALLRDHIRAANASQDPVESFLAAVIQENSDAAKRIAAEHPDLAAHSLHAAAVLGDVTSVDRLLASEPDQLRERRGNPTGDPLLYLCYSPFHGESAERDANLYKAAKHLLAAGADPNTRDGRYNVPALFAVTAARSVPKLARLLLDAGARPDDEESLFHSAERARIDSLELLVGAGANVNYAGEYGMTALYFLARWYDVAQNANVRTGFEWLLSHGADPNVRCGKEQETVLHLAARRGQAPSIVRALIDVGADVNLRRRDGATPLLLARRRGNEELANLLTQDGATTVVLTPADQLLAACGRGDVAEARRLTSREIIRHLDVEDLRMLPEAAAAGRVATVAACLAAGFPVNTQEEGGATALHHAAINGRLEMVQMLLAAGAGIGIRDRDHHATQLGWAQFGADFFRESPGDYGGTVRALLAAGARTRGDEYRAKHPDVRAAMEDAGY